MKAEGVLLDERGVQELENVGVLERPVDLDLLLELLAGGTRGASPSSLAWIGEERDDLASSEGRCLAIRSHIDAGMRSGEPLAWTHEREQRRGRRHGAKRVLKVERGRGGGEGGLRAD